MQNQHLTPHSIMHIKLTFGSREKKKQKQWREWLLRRVSFNRKREMFKLFPFNTCKSFNHNSRTECNGEMRVKLSLLCQWILFRFFSMLFRWVSSPCSARLSIRTNACHSIHIDFLFAYCSMQQQPLSDGFCWHRVNVLVARFDITVKWHEVGSLSLRNYGIDNLKFEHLKRTIFQLESLSMGDFFALLLHFIWHFLFLRLKKSYRTIY